jgi:L-iditol 2-dehydrogenase
MRALLKRSQDADDADLMEVLTPARPADHEVIVDVTHAGICGTDLHILKGHYKVVPPVVMGHEFVGTVAVLGASVDGSLLGKRVVGETFFSTCGQCRYCRSGRRNLCYQRKSIGTHVNGAFAPRLRLPSINLHTVPDGLPNEVAVLAEPLACVVNALHPHAPLIGVGDRVLVTGPGTIGLLAFLLAHASGALVTVRGTKQDEARLNWAAKRGAKVSVAGEETMAADCFDVVVECSGNRHGVADGLAALAKGGRFIQIGVVGSVIETAWDMICFKELVVSSGFASTPASWDRAVAMLPQLGLDGFVTATGGLKDWRGLFDASLRQQGIKFVITPGA